MEILSEDSRNGQLQPPIDDLIVDQVAEFLLDPIRLQFWQIFVDSSQRTSTKGSAKDNAQIEKDAEKQLQFIKFVMKQSDSFKK